MTPWDDAELISAERDALMAEVERLKAGGCARDQGTTQFCAEAVALRAENARLREALRVYALPSNWSVDGTFLVPSPQSEYRPACGDIALAALGEKG